MISTATSFKQLLQTQMRQQLQAVRPCPRRALWRQAFHLHPAYIWSQEERCEGESKVLPRRTEVL